MHHFPDHPTIGEGCDRCRLMVEFAGAQPRYASLPETSAHCFVFYSHLRQVAVVLMVDGNAGASITNSAEGIIQFLYPLHLARRGITINAVRWIYRDSMGMWDEITVQPILSHAGAVSASFKTIGYRQLEDAISTLFEAGLHPQKCDYDRLLCAIATADENASVQNNT